MTTHYTRGQEQDVQRVLKLLGELVTHADRIATALEALPGAVNPEYGQDDEPSYRPVVDVQLPKEKE